MINIEKEYSQEEINSLTCPICDSNEKEIGIDRIDFICKDKLLICFSKNKVIQLDIHYNNQKLVFAIPKIISWAKKLNVFDRLNILDISYFNTLVERIKNNTADNFLNTLDLLK